MCSVESKSLYSNVVRARKYESEIVIELPKEFEEKSVLEQARKKASGMRVALTKARFEAWKSKPQHGSYVRQLVENNADVRASMGWLNKCHLDPHTESYLCAAQELALFTRYHEKHILKNGLDDKCRVCSKEQETIYHLLSGCDNLAKREYFVRHNNVCQYIHQNILKSYSLPCGKNWYIHKPVDVIINQSVEIIYDQVISTDRPIGANRPDIIVKDVAKKKALIIDVSCPCDTNLVKKEAEKIAKYGNLKAELQKMWGVKCTIIPVVVGGLGGVTKEIQSHLSKIPGTPERYMCQKITLLGSKKILSDVLRRK